MAVIEEKKRKTTEGFGIFCKLEVVMEWINPKPPHDPSLSL